MRFNEAHDTLYKEFGPEIRDVDKHRIVERIIMPMYSEIVRAEREAKVHEKMAQDLGQLVDDRDQTIAALNEEVAEITRKNQYLRNANANLATELFIADDSTDELATAKRNRALTDRLQRITRIAQGYEE